MLLINFPGDTDIANLLVLSEITSDALKDVSLEVK